MSHSWKHSWSQCLRVHAINMTLPASSCREEDDGEDDNRICMLWHLHLVINILPVCFAAAYCFPKLDSLMLKDTQSGTQKKKLGCYSPWLPMKDGSFACDVMALHRISFQHELLVIHWQRIAILLYHQNIPHSGWRPQKAEILPGDFIPSTGSYSALCIILW